MWAADTPPDVLVRQTTHEVLELIRADKEITAGNQTHLTALIEAHLLSHFDFERMTRSAVGKNWKHATSDEQNALVREFQTLLVRTYSVALTSYADQTIEVTPLTTTEQMRRVVVHTKILQPDSKPVSMDYRMASGADGWKVYDVSVEGISLVINYRSLFASTIESDGVSGLIALLRTKNKDVVP